MILQKIEEGKIDKEMIPLIKALNQSGIKTVTCCSGHKHNITGLNLPAYVAIDLESIEDVHINSRHLIIYWFRKEDQ